jgi:hypothetical protein
LADLKSLLTDVRLLLYGRQVFLGVKSADGHISPKGRRRGPTMLRNAFLACPKTIAAMFLQVFESSFELLDGGVLPVVEVTGYLPKII